MSFGIGIDLVCIRDFDQILKGSEAFVQDHFTNDEIQYCRRGNVGETAHFAVRFAAKEAYVKALESLHLFRPQLFQKLPFLEVEIQRDPCGRPYFVFYGQLKSLMEDLGLLAQVSLSHDGDYATAQVLLRKS